ncbi:glycosyltransferase family 2 protein [Candidatus Kaiserbacteria bacterium]|nr:glycosyltransferase family 2 protein [Candidatus Kaiserbacteria bacterium]
MPKINATLALLTRNSAHTLDRALESSKDFDEIVVVDGASTDATPQIAQKYGARIISQDPLFLAADGSIKNFGAVRNQYVHASKHDWIFVLDADEKLTPELVQEIRSVVSTGVLGAYWVSRLYEYDGYTVTCSASYPSQQMRFFHRAVVAGYIKRIHERLELKAGTEPKHLKNHMLVPLVNDMTVVRRKWQRYIEIECARQRPIAPFRALRLIFREFAMGILFLIRIARTYFLCRGTHLPFSLELTKPLYQFMLIGGIMRSIGRK